MSTLHTWETPNGLFEIYLHKGNVSLWGTAEGTSITPTQAREIAIKLIELAKEVEDNGTTQSNT